MLMQIRGAEKPFENNKDRAYSCRKQDVTGAGTKEKGLRTTAGPVCLSETNAHSRPVSRLNIVKRVRVKT